MADESEPLSLRLKRQQRRAYELEGQLLQYEIHLEEMEESKKKVLGSIERQKKELDDVNATIVAFKEQLKTQ
jgi:hypothetical protein